MIHTIRDELESTVTPLIREIIDDARRLMQQEADLIRVEVREESVKIRQAMTWLAIGSAAVFVALVLAAFMVVQLIATEWFQAPLWVAFGVVALITSLAGGVFVFLGGRKLREVRRSSEQTMKALKGGFEWMQQAM